MFGDLTDFVDNVWQSDFTAGPEPSKIAVWSSVRLFLTLNIPPLPDEDIDGFGPRDAEEVVEQTITMQGGNIGLADGSVRNIARSLNWQTVYELCGARDGRLSNSNEY